MVKLPKQETLGIPVRSFPSTITMSYLVQIKRPGDEKYSSEHGGDVRYNGLQTVADLLAGILSVSRVGRMNAHRLTEITVTVSRRERGAVTRAIE